MNPFYVDQLYSVLRGMRPRVWPDKERIRKAISRDDVYDVLVDAFGADLVHEATLRMEKMWPTVFIERAASVTLYRHAQRLHQLLSTMQRQVRLAHSDEMRLLEAPREVGMDILREAYGTEAVNEAERQLAEIKQAVGHKELEMFAEENAKTHPAHQHADNLEPV